MHVFIFSCSSRAGKLAQPAGMASLLTANTFLYAEYAGGDVVIIIIIIILPVRAVAATAAACFRLYCTAVMYASVDLIA